MLIDKLGYLCYTKIVSTIIALIENGVVVARYAYDSMGNIAKEITVGNSVEKGLLSFGTADTFYINHGGMNALRTIFWGSKALIGETLSRALFVSGSTALSRWLIDLIILDLH